MAQQKLNSREGSDLWENFYFGMVGGIPLITNMILSPSFPSFFRMDPFGSSFFWGTSKHKSCDCEVTKWSYADTTYVAWWEQFWRMIFGGFRNFQGWKNLIQTRKKKVSLDIRLIYLVFKRWTSVKGWIVRFQVIMIFWSSAKSVEFHRYSTHNDGRVSDY